MNLVQGLILFTIGVFAGVISGMGIGGGTILIPALYMFLGIEQQSAQNINLIYFVPTAVIALITHARNGRIEKTILLPIIAAGVPCAILGAFIALRIDSGVLRHIFGYFLAFMGIAEFFRKEK